MAPVSPQKPRPGPVGRDGFMIGDERGQKQRDECHECRKPVRARSESTDRGLSILRRPLPFIGAATAEVIAREDGDGRNRRQDVAG